MPILVQIEHCKNCHLHEWNSRHDEIKYIDFYEQLTEKIISTFPQSQVIERSPPSNLVERKTPASDGAQFINIETRQPVHFPRLGSFQVYVQGMRIFSKIKTKRWPKIARVIEKIRLVIIACEGGEDITKYDVDYVQFNESEILTNKMLYDVQTIFRVRRSRYNGQTPILQDAYQDGNFRRKKELNRSLNISRKYQTIGIARETNPRQSLNYGAINPESHNSSHKKRPGWKDPQQKDFCPIKNQDLEYANNEPFNPQKIYLQETYPRKLVANYRKKKITLNKIDSHHLVLENQNGEKQYYIKQVRLDSRRQTPNPNPRRKLKPIQDNNKNEEEGRVEGQISNEDSYLLTGECKMEEKQDQNKKLGERREKDTLVQVQKMKQQGQNENKSNQNDDEGYKNIKNESEISVVQQNDRKNIEEIELKQEEHQQAINKMESYYGDENMNGKRREEQKSQEQLILQEENKDGSVQEIKFQCEQNNDEQQKITREQQDMYNEEGNQEEKGTNEIQQENKIDNPVEQDKDQQQKIQQEQLHKKQRQQIINNRQKMDKVENISEVEVDLKYSIAEKQAYSNSKQYRKQSVESGNNKSIDLGPLIEDSQQEEVKQQKTHEKNNDINQLNLNTEGFKDKQVGSQKNNEIHSQIKKTNQESHQYLSEEIHHTNNPQLHKQTQKKNIQQQEEKIGQGLDNNIQRQEKIGEGQEKIGEGQDKIGQGQDKNKQGQDKIGQGQDKIGQGQDKIDQREDKNIQGIEIKIQGQEINKQVERDVNQQNKKQDLRQPDEKWVKQEQKQESDKKHEGLVQRQQGNSGPEKGIQQQKQQKQKHANEQLNKGATNPQKIDETHRQQKILDYQEDQKNVVQWEAKVSGVQFNLLPHNQQAKKVQNQYALRVLKDQQQKIDKSRTTETKSSLKKDTNIVQWEAYFESHAFKIKKMI